MKTVFDQEAFYGCLGFIIVLILVPVAIFFGWFLLRAILFVLPAIVAGLIILAIPVVLFYAFREMFFKKVE
ncbi:MAG: hypothetical protein E7041_04450 [Lentisphaerae bacterium]|nr:hypothetical protein [Lentisphaerota bacterium]